MVNVGKNVLIYLHTILGEEIVSRDGLPWGVMLSDILKIEKYCPALKVRFSSKAMNIYPILSGAETLLVNRFFNDNMAGKNLGL